MKVKKILKELEKLLKNNEMDIIYGTGSFSGGYCLINNSSVVVINKRTPAEEKATVLVNIILTKQIDLTNCKASVIEFINRFN